MVSYFFKAIGRLYFIYYEFHLKYKRLKRFTQRYELISFCHSDKNKTKARRWVLLLNTVSAVTLGSAYTAIYEIQHEIQKY